MFDNPGYRWRDFHGDRTVAHASKAIAWILGLSLDQGLLGKKRARNMASENNPVPTQDQLNALVNDTSRVETRIGAPDGADRLLSAACDACWERKGAR